MADNKIPGVVLAAVDVAAHNEVPSRAPLASRLVARLRAGRFDRLIAVGVPAAAGSALAVHEARLTSAAERQAIARTLRLVLRDAQVGGLVLSSRVPVHIPNVKAAEQQIDAVTLRLHSPRPVSARGMARLRQILGDGAGPLYRYGRGDLRGRLGAALAAL
jgi:hypothetical protein